ncbi:cupin domain-containing protein [Bordetella sp. 02P26C-1]|uniref:cupin domain-containing protein n=1 Tax=Bordetella sp. 02P26C-1 TaxID=2683195 RepID=UPI0013557539|nr:cupin domain-containing protein [Bordetella sp. 02P26C-1]MVW79529.1 DUF861 domain-containing protein [Bordetella sp. 02P26C-1]
MAVIHVAQTADISDIEPIGPVGKPLSEPACQLRLREFDIAGASSLGQGIWECSPGKFRREVKSAEVMHILSGKGVFTSDNGEATVFQAGDTIMMSPLTQGVWEIQETVRKVYVLLPAAEA